jgi:hypothetical protein
MNNDKPICTPMMETLSEGDQREQIARADLLKRAASAGPRNAAPPAPSPAATLALVIAALEGLSILDQVRVLKSAAVYYGHDQPVRPYTGIRGETFPKEPG